MADFPDLKAYVAQLETIFARLAKIGHVVTDADKRYHLMENLTEDFRRGVGGSIYTYEGPQGQPADYSKALQFLAIYDDNNLATPKKFQREAAMATFATQENKPVCRNFAKGVCRWGDQCKFRHVSAPGRPAHISKRRKLTQSNLGGQPRTRRQYQPPRASKKNKEMKCWRCGSTSHKKFNCRVRMDRANHVVDARCDGPDPVLDGLRAQQDQNWICQEEPVSVSHQSAGNALQDEIQALPTDYAYPCGTTHSHLTWDWLLDGGSTCCVCAFPREYSPYLFNRRRVDVTLVVGGDHRLQCQEVADMIARIRSEDGTTFVGEFTNIRLVEGFGTNLMSCPRMVQAGWNINHNSRGFTGSNGRVLFTTRASANGLHYLRGVQPLRVAPAAGKKIFLPGEDKGDDNVGTIFNCATSHRERAYSTTILFFRE